MKLVWFTRNDGNLYANSSAGLYCIHFDDEQGLYVLSLRERHLFHTANLEEAKSWAEEFVDALRAAKRRLRELLRLKAATQQERTRTRRSNDEDLADEYLNYDPDTEAMLEAFSRRIDEVRVEETTD
ncbi:hypothetical protein J2T22_001635 [Pseudarthrobacter defluvii]|uniref:PH domain-containing protein n=1 Tax=Pseudarthrobacter defluvii TaxID=410837 RepID=A0ABT9UFM7_9MICC|nr:hypothetical protein [Pseudarthrobacter defluvii]MDQ0118457.1 hypothetical protein [Pseudarthrobacter defluvii]